MNKANYKNANNRYPVSTDTFDFIQQQIELPYKALDLLVGDELCILKQPTSSVDDGLIIFNHELMPLKSGDGGFIKLVTETKSISVSDTTFENARVERYAVYTEFEETNDCYPVSDALMLNSLCALKERFEREAQHYVPKGAIMMWSGALSAIPDGWKLCDGGTYNQITTPDLKGRFVLGVDPYLPDSNMGGVRFNEIGISGGELAHTLTIEEMPKHSHEIDVLKIPTPTGNKYVNLSFASGAKGTYSILEEGESKAHNNMPPYYVLAYIMKII